MADEVLHFGGNGHASSRLVAARGALADVPGAPTLVDVPYPGFEGRPGAATRDEFLDNLAYFCRDHRAVAGYASGIGALIALGLRARGELNGLPLIVQGPVLWGLQTRAFPRLLRVLPPARGLLRKLFARRGFREHFARKHFRKPLTGEPRERFFEGYARCAALGDFFRWFTPAYLRQLECTLAGHPERLRGVTVWLGGYDRVVGEGEVCATEKALGVSWPVVRFPGWGHYPMIDEPKEWADALCQAVARRPDR
ncbi:MAG: alpha/beta hydrolase [Planctomycetia bacterium]|nr:alpha/beta hydrolase [Planctomycetia bacterium]